MRTTIVATALAACLLAGCGGEGDATVADRPATSPPASSPTVEPSQMLCNPSMGSPVAQQGCPDDDPLLGRVMAWEGDELRVQPIRSYTNDDAGRRYAEEHGLDYPFANDTYDAEVGEPVAVTVPEGTICTGAIVVRGGRPASDHVTTCKQYAAAVHRRQDYGMGVTSALFFDGERLVQLSELYRP